MMTLEDIKNSLKRELNAFEIDVFFNYLNLIDEFENSQYNVVIKIVNGELQPPVLQLKQEYRFFVDSPYINKRYKYLKLNQLDLVEERILDYLQKWQDLYSKDMDNSLYIFGAIGVGKTSIAISLFNEFKSRNKYYISMTDLYFRVKESWKQDSYVSESNIIDEMKQYDLLVIDDLGSTTTKDESFIWNIIFQIVEYRYSNYLTTVYTSNLKLDEFGSINCRIADRIKGSLWNKKAIEIKGSSNR